MIVFFIKVEDEDAKHIGIVLTLGVALHASRMRLDKLKHL
jgi:hypothetical protein